MDKLINNKSSCLKIYFLLIFCFLFVGVLSSCTGNSKTLKIGVISDLHYLSEQLMDTGSAVSKYDKGSGKAILEVPYVLEQVLNDYLNIGIDILFIPGDMTKDGEKQSHIDLVKKLRPLMNSGVRVFVIPGNHDITRNALGYKGDNSYPVANIDAGEFARIYADCGYKDALKRDSESLSYLAELSSDTWLLAIDSNKYNEQKNNISAGEISEATEKWLSEILNEAKQKNIQVIGMMHHGLVEHIMMQSVFFGDYIIKDWQRLAPLFADLGMKAIFTGHFHANDISEFVSQTGNKIYDIETGSLAVYPFPYRFVELNKKGLKISTKNITSTDRSPQLAMQNKILMQERARQIAHAKIQERNMQFPAKTLSLITDIIAKVFVMHLEGDEKIDEELRKSIMELSNELESPIDISDKELEFDLFPADNNVYIKF